MAQTVAAPFVDGFEGFGPTFSSPQTVVLPFLDGGVGFGPLLEHGTATGLEVLAGATVVDSFSRSFREPIADAGSFEVSVLRSDFTGIGIDFDDVVSFQVSGHTRFQGMVEQLDHQALSTGEAADQVVRMSGRNEVAAILDQAVVQPSRGPGSVPIEEVRSFSWVAPDFDSDSWPSAKNVNRQREYADWRSPVPWIWPDITAFWIWANIPQVSATFAPPGSCLFRKKFTLASEEDVRIFVAFDLYGNLWVDGALMTGFASFTVGRYIEMTLGAGEHTLAAKVINEDKGSLPNPGGLICAVYTTGTGGLLDEVAVNTDATWDCLPYPTAIPGYTHGQVIRLLLEEAGLDAYIGLDFTDELDTDGNPWSQYREISVQVGRTLFEVLREMSDAFIDVAPAPGARRLRAWNRGERGIVRPATLQQTADPATSDFLSLTHSGSRTRLNKALVRYGGGTVEVTDSASITAHGPRGGYIELGNIPDTNTAEKIAAELMESRAQPNFSTSAVLHPRGASTSPYDGFEVGDWVTCPDETDNDAPMRVVAITLAEDDEGVIDWPVELRDQQYELEERHSAWLRRMADGALFGGARVSSPAGKPDPITQQVTALRVAEFSYDNSTLVASLSPRRPAEASGNMVEIYVEVTTAGTTSTVVRILKNGVTLGSSLTLPAGATEAELPLNIVPIRANIDKLQCQIVTAGSGAKGLDVQVRAI